MPLISGQLQRVAGPKALPNGKMVLEMDHHPLCPYVSRSMPNHHGATGNMAAVEAHWSR